MVFEKKRAVLLEGGNTSNEIVQFIAKHCGVASCSVNRSIAHATIPYNKEFLSRDFVEEVEALCNNEKICCARGCN